MKKLLFILIVIFSVSFAPLAANEIVLAQNGVLPAPLQQACDEAKANDPNNVPITCNNTTQSTNPIFGPDGIMIKAARLIALITGVACVIVIIVSGIRYSVSAGDSNSINSAKNAIMYALIGLVVSIIAPIIIGFVLQKFIIK